MAPKAANKESASKDPATASKAPEKKDAGKKTAASSDKTKHTKTHKETYSSYILYLSHFASTARSRTRVYRSTTAVLHVLNSESRERRWVLDALCD
ncbi:hypothetical protein ACHAPQ_012380 [Fusarium lateritium]